jgi:class 3 adenylate cyclase
LPRHEPDRPRSTLRCSTVTVTKPAADVVGYSRLMGADEERTHERLKAHLRELVNPTIAEHSGRIVKNTGDASWRNFYCAQAGLRRLRTRDGKGWLIP